MGRSRLGSLQGPGWGQGGCGACVGRAGGRGRWAGNPRNAWRWCPVGKYAALDTQAIGPLLELLHSSLSKARLNAIKVLTMLAEAPEGRKILQSHVPTFRALKEDTSAAVQRAAQIAVKVIEWKP